MSNTKSKAVHFAKVAGLDVGSVQRTPLRTNETDRISIGTLTSPDDEYLDMTEDEIMQIREKFRTEKESGELAGEKFAAFVRQERSSETGLLLVYLPANENVKSADGILNQYGLADNECGRVCGKLSPAVTLLSLSNMLSTQSMQKERHEMSVSYTHEKMESLWFQLELEGKNEGIAEGENIKGWILRMSQVSD